MMLIESLLIKNKLKQGWKEYPLKINIEQASQGVHLRCELDHARLIDMLVMRLITIVFEGGLSGFG